jgi:hypothetical protein
LAKHGTEKYIKTLVGLGGKKNIDAALERLDKLTAEEARSVGVMNLEAIHRLKSCAETTEARTQDIQEHIHGLASGAQKLF